MTLLGTTSISTPDPADRSTSADEVALLRQEAARLVPAAAEVRVLRAFAGVRPLYQPGGSAADGRAVTRATRSSTTRRSTGSPEWSRSSAAS